MSSSSDTVAQSSASRFTRDSRECCPTTRMPSAVPPSCSSSHLWSPELCGPLWGPRKTSPLCSFPPWTGELICFGFHSQGDTKESVRTCMQQVFLFISVTEIVPPTLNTSVTGNVLLYMCRSLKCNGSGN